MIGLKRSSSNASTPGPVPVSSQSAAVRQRSVEQQGPKREEFPPRLEKALENPMFLDLPGQGLCKAGEEGEAGLASFGRAPGEVEVGDIGRHHLNQGLADHRIDHRVHLGVEPMNVPVRSPRRARSLPTVPLLPSSTAGMAA